MTGQDHPPGWYPDPLGEGSLRWYDGGWTEHVRDQVPSREPEPGPYIHRRTSMGRNYNNGRHPNPYVSDNPSDFWNGVFLIFCFLTAAFVVLGGC